ncbi:hypothetical protein AC626_21835 [Pseudoalteromonas rubra]|uniref:Uncharacterized protein n=1 Tax=Pseudoalteromonas rubra TaxID=43658 RepID=A0A0L0EMP0_9GAMM|nr:hypothetical protein AC626_21835 [Pseudoalteromonas rubra]
MSLQENPQRPSTRPKKLLNMKECALCIVWLFEDQLRDQIAMVGSVAAEWGLELICLATSL